MGGGYYERDVEVAAAPAKAADAKQAQARAFDSRFPPQPFSMKADQILGAVTEIHQNLRPNKEIKASVESPVVICCDVTGSMGSWPKVIWDKLPMMYGQTILHGYLTEPAFCFAACGDAYGDAAPLQIGDFAEGSDIDNWITKIFVEGGGGGGPGSKPNHETYELAAYYFANHCDLGDAKTPMFFFIGDESFYPTIESKMVRSVLGDDIKDDLDSSAAFEALKKAFKGNVFLIHRTHPSVDNMVLNKWKRVLGANRVLTLDNPKAGVDCMLGVMSIISGAGDLEAYIEDMEDRDQTPERIDEVSAALAMLSLPAEVEEEEKDERKVIGSVSITSLAGPATDIAVVEEMTLADLQLKIEQEIGLAFENQVFPTLGEELPDPVPASIPLRAKIAELDSNTGLVRFDLQWGYPGSGKDFLDGTCFIFNDNKFQGLVDFSHNSWKQGAVSHSGDVMDEKKSIGHHLITVDFKKLAARAAPPDIVCGACTMRNPAGTSRCTICGTPLPSNGGSVEPAEDKKANRFIFAMSACRRPTIADYKRPAVRLLDAKNTELGTYEIAQAKNSQAVIMCELAQSDEGWIITEWGLGSSGTVRNYEPLKRSIYRAPGFLRPQS